MTEPWTGLTTAADFYAYFEKIPEEKWITGDYRKHGDESCRCAYGHLGSREGEDDEITTPESGILSRLIYGLGFAKTGTPFHVAGINDNEFAEFPQKTPKERILAALKLVMELTGAGNEHRPERGSET